MQASTRKSLRIMISLSGLGLGNATRQHALLEELRKNLRAEGRTLDPLICAWGCAAEYFRGRAGFSLVELEPYPAGPRTFFRNCGRVFRALRRHRPSLLLLDSDYHLPAYFFFRSRIIYVGQAWNVVAAVLRSPPKWPLRVWRKFVARELADALYQSAFAGTVLVPSFRPEPEASGQKGSFFFRRIPLLVRPSYRAPSPTAELADRTGWAVALSGSGLESGPLRSLAAENGFAILAPDRDGKPACTETPALDSFRGVITQCGLSSLSEAIARRLPMALIPMREHPEQFVNALAVTKLGWGTPVGSAPLASITDELASLGPLPADKTSAMTNGAAIAAALVLAREPRV